MLHRGVASVDLETIQPGQLIAGRYRVEKMLGLGASAGVFEASHVAMGHSVALKVLRSREGDAETRLARFLQEARITAQLNHPNTIRVFDFGQDDSGFVFLVMELLTGPTLRAELNQRLAAGSVFREEDATEVGIAVLRSLHEAHERGLVHRDLKPENVMYHRVHGEAPLIKVLDFGVAKLDGMQLTAAQDVAPCTPVYASPEQATGLPVSERSDLYSLGVILFELVCGVKPFQGANALETLYMQAHAPVPEVRKHARVALTDQFAQVIERAMDKDPARRFEDAQRMRARLENCREVRKLLAADALATVSDTPERRPAPIPMTRTDPRTDPETDPTTAPRAVRVEVIAPPTAIDRPPPIDGPTAPVEPADTAPAQIAIVDTTAPARGAIVEVDRAGDRSTARIIALCLVVLASAGVILAWAMRELDEQVVAIPPPRVERVQPPEPIAPPPRVEAVAPSPVAEPDPPVAEPDPPAKKRPPSKKKSALDTEL